MKQFFLMLGMGMVIMSCHKSDSSPAPVLNLNVTSISLPPVPGATADLIVESNLDWKVYVGVGGDWLDVDKITGKGNDTIHIKVVKDNEHAEARSAVISVMPINSGIDLQVQAAIEQKPYNVQVVSQKTFGGTGDDRINDVKATADGGLFLTGTTGSNNNGDVRANHGDIDAWMVRLNSNRDTVWTRVMGGTWADEGTKAIVTADGGFVVVGNTQSSNNGDVGTNHGLTDWWIIKLKSNGDTAWTKLVGGAYEDFVENITATADGGFVVVGSTSPSKGNEDVMVVKFDSNGNIAWQKTYGGSNTDRASAVTIYPNGSMMIAAITGSSASGDVGPSNGLWDYWIIKLTAGGDIEWTKLYGGAQFDAAWDIDKTADGGAVIMGSSNSNTTGNVGPNHGSFDLWVLRVNASGDIVWKRLLGGTGWESGGVVKVTPDGGCLIAGDSDSTDGDVGPTQGDADLWVFKLSASGSLLWSKTFGGTGYEEETALLLNTDGSFYVTAVNNSNTRGEGDGWLLKLKDY